MKTEAKDEIRVFSRVIARELTADDIKEINGGCTEGCYRGQPGHTHDVTNCGSDVNEDSYC